MILIFFLLSQAFSECELPNMSAGHFNVTTERQFKDIMRKEPAFLVGLSASWCEDCCKKEPLYKALTEALDQYRPRIPLVRIGVAASPFIKKYLNDQDSVPQILGVRKGTFYRYLDLHNTDRLVRFADRLYYPVQYLHDIYNVNEFLEKPEGKFDTLRILGVLYDTDLKEQFENAMGEIANWFTTEIRAVMNKALIKELKQTREEVVHLNCIIILRGDDVRVLDLEVPQDIPLWVRRNSVGLVDELTPYNFQMYEANAIPMLIMFMDPKNVKNSEYIEIYTRVARNFQDKVTFTWVDGTSPDYVLKRRKLGLVTDFLPGIAFNLGSREIYPYSESKSITEENLDKFVQGFIDGKPYVPNKAVKARDPAMPNCTPLSRDEFPDYALKDGYDAVFLVYSSKESQEIAPVFDRICRRLKELEFLNLNSYIIDVATGPVHKTVKIDKVPMIYLAPAYSKSPPYVHYTGKIDALQIMYFIEKYAGIKISLPELPHLSPDEVDEYWANHKRNDENSQQEGNKEEL